MKKNNSKILIILGVLIFLIAILLIIFTTLTTPDKNTTLTAIEKRWVDNNKNKVIDIAVTNNIPLFSYEGDGIFYNYLKNFEKDINLSFNIISYNYGEQPSMEDYKFEIVDKVNDNQLLMYQDSYVLLSKDRKRIDNLSLLNGNKIGVLNDKVDEANYYLNFTGANFLSYDNIDTLFTSLNNGELNSVLVPYTLYLNTAQQNKYNVIYKTKDIVDSYVITLSKENSTVNNIMRKYLDLWLNTKYTDTYNTYFNKLYMDVNQISSKTLSKFRNKDYVYGYVDNLPYESVVNNNLIGINGEYISKYSELAKINFKFKKYSNSDELIGAFNRGEIDIMFNDVSSVKPSSKAYKTTSVYSEKYVVLTSINNIDSIESIKSLKDKKIYVKKDSSLLDYVDKNISSKTVEYETNNALFSNLNDNMIIVVDYNVYDYYKNSKFYKFKVEYTGTNTNQYTFMINNKSTNKIFIDNFDYYISSINEKVVANSAVQSLIVNPKNETLAEGILNYLLYYVLPIFIGVVVLSFIFNKKKKNNVIKKDERLRFIDHLTSLKNRNYLNSKIKEWDNSKVYPQTIIIADLNNVKYINDNFGHEEGDKTIKAAANILINTQKENSDIIRTDGNEFLIYLIGYPENEIVAYMKLLYKEFKEVPHNFGAALGYSMINDDIKLIGDAINEATLDMRTNKES